MEDRVEVMLAGIAQQLEANQKHSDQRFHELMDEMRARFGAVDKQFQAVDRRFEAVDARFDRLMTASPHNSRKCSGVWTSAFAS